jgi:hypothetical protein
MNELVVDVGGTNVKVLATRQTEPRKFPSGRKMTPKQMVAGVKQITGDWKYEVVAIGYPGWFTMASPQPSHITWDALGSVLISNPPSDVL